MLDLADFSTEQPALSRRDLLAGTGGALAAALLAPGLAHATAAPPAGGGPADAWLADPQRRYENFLRCTGDLSGRISPQWWRGVYLGVVPGSQPRILFRLEGCEMKRLVRRSPTECELQYRIFTSFNDPETNEPLGGKRWLNPYTQKEVVVEPNIGSTDTTVRLTDRGIVEVNRRNGFEGVIHLHWATQESTLLMAGNKDRPAGTPAPTGEYATHWLDREAARDFDAPRLEMKFNSTFIMFFRSFLDMPPGNGLTVWHASGIKADTVEGLPESYLRELWKFRPELREWLRAGG
jgi:hypothetical protein